jgi:hypothetical protein
MSSSILQYETSFESEAFFESLAEAASTGRRHPQLQLLAMRAARAALTEGLKGCGGEGFDQECEDEASYEASWESGAYFHQSYSLHEGAPALMMMEHLGHSAAEAESDGEAFAFLAPLLPLAMKAVPFLAKGAGMLAKKLIPKAISTVAKVAPKVMKSVQGAAKVLRANPVTKPLIQSMPRVVQQTTADIMRNVAQGKPVTAQTAVRSFAKNTANVLGNPQTAVSTIRRAKGIDQRMHKVLNAATNGRALPSPAAKKPCLCQ